MKKALIVQALLAVCLLHAGTDPLAELRSARKAMEKEPGSAEKYLQNANPEIRRFAVYTIAKKQGRKGIPTLCRAMSDKDEFVRYTAVLALKSMSSDPAAQAQLKKTAESDPCLRITKLVGSASLPFHQKRTLIRQDSSWDHDVNVVKKFQIPQDNWKLKADPGNQGLRKRWFDVKLNDKDWKATKVGEWEENGLPDYDGYAWYRIRFTMPEKIDSNAVEIHFDAVDESAWVWVNGTYIGDHDLGADGWNTPFALDCRNEILWGKENVVVVRILDRGFSGGIWKPVSIEILK